MSVNPEELFAVVKQGLGHGEERGVGASGDTAGSSQQHVAGAGALETPKKKIPRYVIAQVK